ncbi:MAG TPA: Gfo/Idh/MocA family oxidoreductase [Tepidisphaeraceae bacterium]|nr:Gfo/Idh/MocA family oxidoreductase [Tepidisphaeraceae bacterium]
MNPTRRQFIQSAAAAGAVLGAPLLANAADSGPRRFKTALIGSGWWGKNILAEAIASKRCDIVALCDVDGNILEQAQDHVNDLTGSPPKIYKDFRELLDKEKPEIAIIATPDHWHALQSIAALKAGAHVYVEKPTGHTVNESRAVVNAARQTGKVVQVGLHRRIGPHYVSARKFFLDGNVGELGMVRCFVDSGGGRENPSDNAEPPEGLDWDMWCGPGPLVPFNRKLHPGGWRNFLSYANGQLGDWGVHWLDQVQWFTGEKYPRRIFSSAGRQIRGTPINDGKRLTSDAPDHQAVIYDFEKFTCTWEHRQFAGNATEKHSIGVYFYGTKGILHVGWQDGWTFYPTSGNKTIHENAQIQQPDGHNIKLLWADFLGAIDENRRPVADIEPAHRASTMAMLGMLSWKVGRSLKWDGDKEQVVGDAEANGMLSRVYRRPWVYPAL